MYVSEGHAPTRRAIRRHRQAPQHSVSCASSVTLPCCPPNRQGDFCACWTILCVGLTMCWKRGSPRGVARQRRKRHSPGRSEEDLKGERHLGKEVGRQLQTQFSGGAHLWQLSLQRMSMKLGFRWHSPALRTRERSKDHLTPPLRHLGLLASHCPLLAVGVLVATAPGARLHAPTLHDRV